jgi:hypothetical protein
LTNGERSDSGIPSPSASDTDDAGVEVVIKFDPARIRRWRATGFAPPDLIEVGDAVVTEGLALEPTHPDATDADLQAWYHTMAPDADAADQIVELLLASPAVVSAFVKPPAAPPG